MKRVREIVREGGARRQQTRHCLVERSDIVNHADAVRRRREQDAADGYSVNRLTRLRHRPMQLLHRPQYPPPHRSAVQVARLKHGIGPHGGMDRRDLRVSGGGLSRLRLPSRS